MRHLQPHVHYLPAQADGSDVAEVVAFALAPANRAAMQRMLAQLWAAEAGCVGSLWSDHASQRQS